MATAARGWPIDIFCYRVQKYIGAYLAAMGGADAIVFAGGIGENSPEVRAAHLRRARLARDRARPGQERRRDGHRGPHRRDGSRLEVWVIPTDEELLIARDTWRVVTGADVRY